MKNTKKLVLSALFSALACVATMVIRIPTPGTSGYIHPGDAIVILAGIFLGPVYGGLAAGIGSAMSDMIGGYFVYVPITFLVKGAVACFTALAFRSLRVHNVNLYIAVAVGGIIDTILVVFGYFLFESVLYGAPGAAASMIPNMVQGLSGLVISMLLFPALQAVPDFKHLLHTSPIHHK